MTDAEIRSGLKNLIASAEDLAARAGNDQAKAHHRAAAEAYKVALEMISTQLTAEVIKKYLEEPHRCPFCESDKISSDSSPEWDTFTVSRRIWCQPCGRAWDEVFQLTTIEAA